MMLLRREAGSSFSRSLRSGHHTLEGSYCTTDGGKKNPMGRKELGGDEMCLRQQGSGDGECLAFLPRKVQLPGRPFTHPSTVPYEWVLCSPFPIPPSYSFKAVIIVTRHNKSSRHNSLIIILYYMRRKTANV